MGLNMCSEAGLALRSFWAGNCQPQLYLPGVVLRPLHLSLHISQDIILRSSTSVANNEARWLPRSV